MTVPARGAAQRVADTLHRLEHDVDAWVATASPQGEPCMVPLSFLWDGSTLLFSTLDSNPTARNLAANGQARVAVGPTRDVVLMECAVETVPAAQLPPGVVEAFADKTGFRPGPRYVYLRMTPLRVQAWREVNELADRDLPPL
ncbi:pyridoxamine 5'-phosphate oxidase family protein [Dactylosporangium sp. NBC_01737]|uniref:pyridoxamine 5'-phosphate oxidase family protein n=1 Tax=Dactylosporangium sp. NBC_01737 TaxID=2975959 RepID=UPI002E13DB55|nr:pyridoxamine 5'-phosphate oxidase family protein [Dactylosporangium sp. NBC_01737]